MKIATPALRTWNVRVHRNGRSIYLGTVVESTEDNARCAALSRFGVETDPKDDAPYIGLMDDFDVSPT